MIMIDVLVPSADRIYDFELSEDVSVAEGIKKIMQLVSEHDNSYFAVGARKLFSYRKGEFLDENATFMQCGTQNKDRLILV